MSEAAWVHDFTTQVPVPRERVFAALVQPSQLRAWFAEQVEADPVPGGPWRFWGRHTPGTPTAPDSRDILLEVLPPERLRFAMTLLGVPGEVELRLADATGDAAGGTDLTLRHALTGPLDQPRSRELVDDFWRLSLGNLTAHLTGGSGLHRPDFGDPHPLVRVAIEIAAPRAAVWRSLLDPEALRKWVGATAPQVDPRPGGTYRYGWQYPIDGRQVEGGPTRILALEPMERLVTDWPDWRGDPTVTGQSITWELEESGAGTRVTLIHSGFGRPADISDFPFGWAWFLGELRKVAEAEAAAGRGPTVPPP